MGPDNYVNRLVDWINEGDIGGTLRDVVTSDLALMGNRIDAFTDGGHKGAHAEVDKLEAARILTGTYLLLETYWPCGPLPRRPLPTLQSGRRWGTSKRRTKAC